MRRQNGGKTGEDNNDASKNDLSDFNEPPWEDPDRDRGILTPSDRKYLLGEAKLEGQDERNARYRIRQRITDALYDIILINIYLQQSRDKRQILDNFDTLEPIEALFKFGYDLLSHEENVDDHFSILEMYIQSLLPTNTFGDGKIRHWSVNIEAETHSKGEFVTALADEVAELQESETGDNIMPHLRQVEDLLRDEELLDELEQEGQDG